MDDIFVGLVALILAYLGQQHHKLTWMGTIIIYLAVSCFILVIPEMYRPKESNSINSNMVHTCKIKKNPIIK